jgi:hypothetical protein
MTSLPRLLSRPHEPAGLLVCGIQPDTGAGAGPGSEFDGPGGSAIDDRHVPGSCPALETKRRPKNA